MNHYTKEFIYTLPKTINSNGCWISKITSPPGQYVHISIKGKNYLLHRVSMCLTYDINYYNDKIQARHNQGCSKRCFNPEHLQPGTQSDNQFDRVRDGTHHSANKKECPKCGGVYLNHYYKYGQNKGKIKRYCPACKSRNKLSNQRELRKLRS